MSGIRIENTAKTRSQPIGSFLRRRALILFWLTFVWAALWGSFSPPVLASGAIGAIAVLQLFSRAVPPSIGRVRPVAILRFFSYFAYRLFVANLVVAWEVVTPKNRINQGVVAVPVEETTDWVITLLANAISLTPGTLSLEIRRDPPLLYIHVLHLKSVDEVRRDIKRLERLVLEAFGDAKPQSCIDISKRKRPGVQ
ncbi:MAG: Na+/H+ antiporter subunit E [Acidimicrobiia bacterium]